MFLILRRIGNLLLDCIYYLGGLVMFGIGSLGMIFTRPTYFAETIKQMYSIGVRSLPLIGLAGMSMGIVLCMQTIDILGQFGAGQYVAAVVGLSVVKELSPVITALLVAGRSGSGISAELGSMIVTRQVDALKVLAVNPQRYLAATRITACVLVLPLLTAIADVLGIAGGLIVAVTQGGINYSTYYYKTLDYVSITDVTPGLIKAAVFGLIIGTVACNEGFNVRGGTEGVGRSTTAAVVLASLLILLSDVYMTRILLVIFPE
ncbi:MAG: ABC transporter permease [Deltaproteobacteria bacterium]|nr:ABC transporter permease [Deltaproteobacteria bacterium]